MHTFVHDRLDELITLAERYHVRRLELFGSAAAADHFDPANSDLDFLVEFKELEPGQYADTYFGLLSALKELFGREVDLVMPKAIRNKYFLESINRNRLVLYAA